MILLDTNVLIHATTPVSPHHTRAKEVCRQAWRQELAACVALQNLCEWYAVVTDSRRFSPPISVEEASHELETYTSSGSVRVIAPSVSPLEHFPQFLRQARSKGAHVFDVLLVATMLEHGAHTIYTENIRDFSRFREIRVVNPFK